MYKQTKNIILILILLGAGVLWWFIIYNQNVKMQEISKNTSDIIIIQTNLENKPEIQIRKNDPACTQNYLVGTENQNFEYVYYGNLKQDMPVQIILSCDQNKFTITGNVNQTIDVTSIVDLPSDVNLVDISFGSNVVYVEDDYNFDGYNDLSSISSNGSQVDSFNIFLYDPLKQKFVFNAELSKLQNINVNPETKYVIEDFSYYIDNNNIESYKNYQWINEHLVEVKK